METKSLTSIVIFGASGDLTKRKLIPSLFNLCRKNRIPHLYIIIGSGGTAYTDEQFRQHLLEGTKEFAGFEFTDQEWSDFAPHLYYRQANYSVAEDFERLSTQLAEIEKVPANRLYYMAIPPKLVPDTVHNLDATGQLHEDGGWRRVVLEKPFGTDLASAMSLNRQILQALNENQ